MTSKPPGASQPASGSSKSTMDGPVATASTGSIRTMARNSSLDTAISAMSSRPAPSSPTTNAPSQQQPDIAHLIQTAGSPEAVIQYLLKEKQSQSQQNGQLWRLVDKQRAMILGLNKDLETALKDKERYRKKLKEFMANPAVLRAAGGQSTDKDAGNARPAPRLDVNALPRQMGANPDSPILESESLKSSPIDMTMAPYPITPPADHPHRSPTAVSQVLDPSHAMPKSHDHAVNQFDHEAEERADDQARKEKGEEQLREIPYNVTLPASRRLPSEPPKMPPPKLPARGDISPRRADSTSAFPGPPRKAPPAPLQLQKTPRHKSSSPPGDESESDYDDLLEVDGISLGDRGRRRTREEDDQKREIIAFNDAEEKRLSEKNKALEPPTIQEPTPSQTQPGAGELDAPTASLAGMLNSDATDDLAPPILSPGLPASPRPVTNQATAQALPLSPRAPAGIPLSPRPPRQAIPMPPNTGIPPSSTASSMNSAAVAPLSISKRHKDEVDSQGSPMGRSSPAERNHIFKGFVTEEFPDLLLPPNALPSINIKVASSRMKPSRASILSLTQLEEDPVFTLAVISHADRSELWRVEKDTASLSKLDQRLKQCSNFTAKTPEKSLFNGHSPAKIDARRQALELYMDEVLNTELDISTAVEVCKYLSTNTLPPNLDETDALAKLKPHQGIQNAGPDRADGRPVRSGYLTKRGKNFGGWKVRFFILDGPSLKYYENPGGPHLGTIKLQQAQIDKLSHSGDNQSPAQPGSGEEFDNQYRHAFLILEPKKKDSSSHVKHVLCAENDEERDLWVDALLQWIDYRGADDDTQVKSPAADRQTSTDPPAGPAKLRKGAAAARSASQPADSDLIGVRYDSTSAGDAPQITGSRPKTSGGLPEHHSAHALGGYTMSSQPKVISGPRDLQLISDAAAWGNKPGPSAAATAMEEKKQRKRSFFGFGPKARSSSDGQDSLFGGSESGSLAAGSSGNAVHVGQVFGASLAEAVRYHPPKDVTVPLPCVVYRCIQYLEAKHAIQEEGIFRLSGSNIVIKQIRERFNNEGDINLLTDEQYYDIHAVASLLKLYLRELPTTILTRDLHLEFLSTTEMPDRNEKVKAMSELAHRLPQANATLLKYLISFLIRIINNADVNKMTVRNVGIVFSPTLNIPAPVFAMFLQNYEGIFGIDPEEYELPMSIEPDTSTRTDGSARFEPPPRPSTSSGSASPHRQPRMESMRDQPRSTPTPPLNVHRVRDTPTPPIGIQRSAYESEHLQNAGPAPSAGRPPYENQHGPPAGYDQQSMQPNHRAAPGYDQPIYQQANDSASGMNMHGQEKAPGNRRRESFIHGAGLQHQGSKSKLRDQTLF